MKLGPILYGTRLYRLHIVGGRATITEDGVAMWRGRVDMLPRVREVPRWIVDYFVGHVGIGEARS